eukprot:8671087-Pyramimonas_sp.AAC.1
MMLAPLTEEVRVRGLALAAALLDDGLLEPRGGDSAPGGVHLPVSLAEALQHLLPVVLVQQRVDVLHLAPGHRPVTAPSAPSRSPLSEPNRSPALTSGALLNIGTPPSDAAGRGM